jgi:hypothetical protein
MSIATTIVGPVIALPHQSIIDGVSGLFVTVRNPSKTLQDGQWVESADSFDDIWTEVWIHPEDADTVELDQHVSATGALSFSNGHFYLI